MRAKVNAPLRRLFTAIDFAPHPAQKSLSALLGQWTALRGAAAAAPLAAMTEALPLNAAVFARAEEDRDYVLLRANPLAPELTGGMADAGARLGAAPDRRCAARLRRLFETATGAGAPVLAELPSATLARAEKPTNPANLLAAPLADAEGRIVGVVCGCAFRRARRGGPRPAPDAAGDKPLIFALPGASALAERVAGQFGLTVAALERSLFEDGRRKFAPLAGARGRDVYVFLDPNAAADLRDSLAWLVIFTGALKMSSARRIVVIAPCLRRAGEAGEEARDDVSPAHVARLLRAVGCDRVVIEADDAAHSGAAPGRRPRAAQQR